MQFIDVLIEAETQLDWGLRANDVERALNHLKDMSPGNPRVRSLQLKLVQLRMADELCRHAPLPRV